MAATPGGTVLPRRFLARTASVLAPELLGVHIVAGGVRAVITEVEAYEPDDPASHSFIGVRPRNRVMFGPAGHLYVYRSYGVHWCANVVCDDDGVGAAVLLRAARVLDGADVARTRRPKARTDLELCAGPGRLCAALALGGEHDGTDLTDGAAAARLELPAGVEVASGGWWPGAESICRTTRIGITKAADAPLRWLVVGDRSVSRPPRRPAGPR